MSVASLAIALILCPRGAAALVLTVDSGPSGSLGILAGAGITITPPANRLIKPAIGAFPTLAIAGLEDLNLMSVHEIRSPVTPIAMSDLYIARTKSCLGTVDFGYGNGTSSTGRPTGEGYYGADTSSVNGDIILDALGIPDADWIFRCTSELGVGRADKLIPGDVPQSKNVFWQVGSSATSGTGSKFVGGILANQAMTLNTGTTQHDAALARVAWDR